MASHNAGVTAAASLLLHLIVNVATACVKWSVRYNLTGCFMVFYISVHTTPR